MLVASACQSGTPTPVADAPPPTKAAEAPAPTKAAVPPVEPIAAEAKAPTPTEPAIAAKPSEPEPATPVFEGPLAATAIDEGALIVWARPAEAEGKSEILALRLDARGVEVGKPVLLRTTTGEVVSIAAHRRADDAWIAWLARVAEDPQPRNLAAVVRVAADLSAMTGPITVDQSVAAEALMGPEIRVLDLADGSAAVGTPSKSATCEDAAMGGDTKCPGFAIVFVGKDGKVQPGARFGADGGDAAVGSLVDVGTGVLFDAWAWHGGPTFGHGFAPRGTATPFPSLPECRPPFERGWTGSELVTLCPADYANEGESCPLPGEDEDDTCARVHAVRLDGTLVTPKDAPANGAPLVDEIQRCEGGHPVLEVRWKDGKLVLDPTRPGASPDLGFGVWTGKHTLTFGGGVRDRWTCTSDGQLVHEERIAAELPFALPTAGVERIKGKL